MAVTKYRQKDLIDLRYSCNRRYVVFLFMLLIMSSRGREVER